MDGGPPSGRMRTDMQKTVTDREAKILTDWQSEQPVAWRAPELAIIVPTLNERLNIVPLLERLRDTLSGVMYEVVFVDDDSADGTPEAVREIGQTIPNVRVIQRIGRRGLASA